VHDIDISRRQRWQYDNMTIGNMTRDSVQLSYAGFQPVGNRGVKERSGIDPGFGEQS